MFLFCSSGLLSQEFGIKVYSGLIANHSQRLLANIGDDHDNYYKDFLYGIDLFYMKKKNGVEIGSYTTTFANDFNLRGNPLFISSKKRFYFKFKVYDFKLGFINRVVNNKKYKLNLHLGFDLSFTNGDIINRDNHHIRDSIIYKTNRFSIDLSTTDFEGTENSYGLYFNLTNQFYLTQKISLSFDLYGRAGFAQYTKLNHIFQLFSNGEKWVKQSAFVTNNGDFLGFNIGLVYNIRFK